MPKIFLIKNRLHQQQLRLAEAQKRADGPPDSLSPIGSPLSYQEDKPLDKSLSKENGESDGSSYSTVSLRPRTTAGSSVHDAERRSSGPTGGVSGLLGRPRG